MRTKDEVDFGFQRLPAAEKTQQVHAVFERVAPTYDLMNDLMSLGMHRWWKRHAVHLLGARSGQQVLDMACGSGDLSRLLARQIQPAGHVVACDINYAMLDNGRSRMINAGLLQQISFVVGNAEQLAFPEHCFDRIIIAFGLRNVTQPAAALTAMYRTLKYGGCLLILEFSKLVLPALQGLYDQYSFRWLPFLGERIADDAASYRYLVESIRRHPDQATLSHKLYDAGFARVECLNMAAGIVAIHRAYKI